MDNNTRANAVQASSNPKPNRRSLLKSAAERQLRAYALGATAAGVGLLALAQPADAQVIFTKENVKVTNGPVFIDVDCGPNVQFWLANRQDHSTFGRFRELDINGSMHAAVVVDSKGPVQLASGSTIGSSRQFRGVYRRDATLAFAYWEQYYFTYSGFTGPWANEKPGYLGLKFDLNGQTHYGWMQIQATGRVQHATPLVEASVTGYAYEATPNTPIQAGQTRGGSAATLGKLARGACQDFGF